MGVKYLDENGLVYLWSIIKQKIGVKQDKVEGKGLSTNDLTNELKSQYDTAQANIIESISVNSVIQTPSGKAVNLSIITSEQVDTKITTAIAGIATFSFEIVSALPATGVSNKIYLVAKTGSEKDVYDEFIWVNNGWESIGSTSIDLTGYVQFNDLTAITNLEIDIIVAM